MSVVKELKQTIADIESRITVIQESCSHPSACVVSTPGANTGNYDPSADSYWIDYHCKLCEKEWREDQ